MSFLSQSPALRGSYSDRVLLVEQAGDSEKARNAIEECQEVDKAFKTCGGFAKYDKIEIFRDRFHCFESEVGMGGLSGVFVVTEKCIICIEKLHDISSHELKTKYLDPDYLICQLCSKAYEKHPSLRSNLSKVSRAVKTIFEERKMTVES